MKQILIVEDSSTVTKILKHLISQRDDISAIYADSLAAGKALYAEHREQLFASIVDLHLPDAPQGESVDYFLEQGIPVIVLTANYQEDKRESLLSKGIVDYVVKESRYSYNYVLKLIDRLEKNRQIKILVAEDSKPARRFVCNLLQRHLYQVLEAEDGLQALDRLKEHPETRMLITDYHMPEMDGFELVRALRQNVDKSDLIIIGLSGDGQGSLSAKFIKNGANDFLQKPFNHEEFYCRIMHNLEELELIEQIRETANRDFLTGTYNGRFFFEKARQLHQQAQQNQSELAVAILGIDHFAQISSSFGFDAASEVLRYLAQELQHAFSRFYLARLDGDTFGLLLPGLNGDKASALLNRFRSMIATMTIDLENHSDETMHITVSAGISNQLQAGIDEQVRQATRLLQTAREAGSNLVMSE